MKCCFTNFKKEEGMKAKMDIVFVEAEVRIMISLILGAKGAILLILNFRDVFY